MQKKLIAGRFQVVPPSPAAATDPAKADAQAKQTVGLDESQPASNIQVWLQLLSMICVSICCIFMMIFLFFGVLRVPDLNEVLKKEKNTIGILKNYTDQTHYVSGMIAANRYECNSVCTYWTVLKSAYAKFCFQMLVRDN